MFAIKTRSNMIKGCYSRTHYELVCINSFINHDGEACVGYQCASLQDAIDMLDLIIGKLSCLRRKMVEQLPKGKIDE